MAQNPNVAYYFMVEWGHPY